ncbi:Hypothetical predicted protein [Mytilus galloprovincialis]|uniref:PHD-type domain-containing protein n=1 Tax=Mytilus galloprovincialis TaxID=29158 RepID=A0A8B6FDH5_MYTGA|nr:Hypothetical predicted protein [Mytilus galloprovincialis]
MAQFGRDLDTACIRIISSEIVDKHTEYLIEVTVGTYTWTVKHRYSDFYELHEKVETNPGPSNLNDSSYPCSICSHECTWDSDAIVCDNCDKWCHIGCVNISPSMYEKFGNSSALWICPICDTPNHSRTIFQSYLSSGIICQEVYKSKNVELIAAQINITDTKSLVIISAYRPPNKNDIDYLKQMIIEINELKLKFKNSTFWLGGDFNLPDIKWPEQNISGSMYTKELNEAFIDMLNNLGIEQMVDFPTRKDNILDLFCTNQPALITKIKSIPGISDHDIVLVDAICKPQRSKQSQHKIYLWKKVDIKKIKDITSHFISELISQANENLNIDQLWNKFKEGSNKIIDDNVPSKITKSKYTNPWANRDIDHLCKKTT